MKRTQGFVLIELIVVLALFGALLGLSSVNLLGSKNTATLTATIDGVVADISSQQTKAMTSTSAGTGTVPYGIRFETNRYILFHGVKYNPADSSNSSISLDARTIFSVINLPDASVVFASRSGEIAGFNPGQSTVTVYQQNSFESKTIHMNQYGVITSVE